MKTILCKTTATLCLAFVVFCHPAAAAGGKMNDDELAQTVAHTGLSVSQVSTNNPNTPEISRISLTQMYQFSLLKILTNGTGDLLYDFTRLGLDINLKNIYFDLITGNMFSDNGSVFLRLGEGYIGLTGITLRGNIKYDLPLTTALLPMNSNTSSENTAVNQKVDVTIQIQKLSIDAIRIGTEPGEGTSMGSVFMSNLVANIQMNTTIRSR